MQVQLFVRVVLVASTLCIATETRAQFFCSWDNPGGGAYSDFTNWDCFTGVPGVDDGAGFGWNSSYGVTFPSNHTTGIVTITSGNVTFSLNSSGVARTLTIPGTLTLDDGNLSVFGGTVDPGALVIKNDGDLVVQGNASVPTGDDSVLVTGQFSNWTMVSGFLRVGEFAEGTLLIEEGASVFNDDGVAIGRFAGSDGAATVTGSNSLLDVDATLTIGQEGTGSLLIEDGAFVDNHLGLGHIAFGADSVGSVTVTDTDSIWTSFGVNVGVAGDGTLSIEAGGNVSNGVGAIGANSGSTGTATVSGADSTWTNSSLVSVGGSGDGTLVIESGGSVSSLDGTIGRFVGSSGDVTVTGADSIWTIADELKVGVLINEFATASLTISDGGSVTSATSVIGGGGNFLNPAPDANVMVSGTNATWSMSGDLLINESGDVAVNSGGTVDVGGDVTVAGQLLIDGGTVDSVGADIFGSGDVIITGTDSNWTISGGLSIAGADLPVFPKFSSLTIQSDGVASVSEDVVIATNGFLVLDGGALTTPTMTVSNDGQLHFLSGALHVEDYQGVLQNQGGMLSPGQSAGSTTIVGFYIQESGGALDIEIGGLTPSIEYDVVSVDGLFQLNGGDLRLTLLDGFVPNFLHTFTVLNVNSEIIGQFDNAANGARVATADGLGSFLVHYGSGSVFNPNHIVLTSFEPACPADTDGNGIVDVSDLLALLAAWGDCPAPCPPSCAADVNGDCEVNVSDLLALLAAWGSCS